MQKKFEKTITEKTNVIAPVGLAGVLAYDRVLEIVERKLLFVLAMHYKRRKHRERKVLSETI